MPFLNNCFVPWLSEDFREGAEAGDPTSCGLAAPGALVGASVAREPSLSEVLASKRGAWCLRPVKPLIAKRWKYGDQRLIMESRRFQFPYLTRTALSSAGIPLHHLISPRGLCHHGGTSWTHLLSRADSHGWGSWFFYLQQQKYLLLRNCQGSEWTL